MSINVGEGEDFEFNVEEAGKWSDEDAQRVVDHLFARGGDVEGSDQYNLIQQINEARGSDVTPSDSDDFDYASATVDQVKEHVGEDEERAQEAYDAETGDGGKNRSSLVDWLTENFDVS